MSRRRAKIPRGPLRTRTKSMAGGAVQHRHAVCATQADLDAFMAKLPAIAVREGIVEVAGELPDVVVSASWGGPDPRAMQRIFTPHPWEAYIPDSEYARAETVDAAALRPGDRLPMSAPPSYDFCNEVVSADEIRDMAGPGVRVRTRRRLGDDLDEKVEERVYRERRDVWGRDLWSHRVERFVPKPARPGHEPYCAEHDLFSCPFAHAEAS